MIRARPVCNAEEGGQRTLFSQSQLDQVLFSAPPIMCVNNSADFEVPSEMRHVHGLAMGLKEHAKLRGRYRRATQRINPGRYLRSAALVFPYMSLDSKSQLDESDTGRQSMMARLAPS